MPLSIPSVTASSKTKRIKKPVTVEKTADCPAFFSVSEIMENVDFVIFSTKSQEKRLQKQKNCVIIKKIQETCRRRDYACNRAKK